MKIAVRKYKEEDREFLINLFNDFGDFFKYMDQLNFIIRDDRYGKVFLNELVEGTKNNGVIYVAENKNKILGFIGGNYKDLNEENTVESINMRKGRILEFFVSENSRGLGIGKLLFNKMEAFFRKNKCNVVNVEVFAQNKQAHELYTHLGFIDRNIDMIKVLEDPFLSIDR